MNWLMRVPWWLIGMVALMLALTPFGESHLIQKWRMLFDGTLRRPLDWFDLVLHTTPLLLLLAKIAVHLRSGAM
jgi:hypothetical protein